MRQVTATEKYRAVNEGKMAKSEFVRQMRQSYPMYISQFDGYDSTVQILKNRQLLFEAAKTEKAFSGAKVYDDRPALTYSLDALERGIRAELAAAGITMPHQGVKPEDYLKAEKKAKDNLEKNSTHYLDLMSGESNKVDKHDKEKEVKRGAADKDTFNDMKKATLKEEVDYSNKDGALAFYDNEDIVGTYGVDDAIEFAKELAMTHFDAGPQQDKFVKDFLQAYKESGYDKGEEIEEVDANPEMSEDAKKNLLGKVVGALRAKYPDVTAGILKDFIKTHYQDLLDGANIEDEFAEYISVNYEGPSDMREGEKGIDMSSKDGYIAFIDNEDILATYSVEDAEEMARELAMNHHDAGQDQDNFVRSFMAAYKEGGYDTDDQVHEKQGKDHDGDGDIDSDDYLAARDKAIKKAMGKDSKEEQLKEAIKSIIKKTLLNEAATVKLSDWAESYESFPGVKPVVNELENVVTEIETFYDKMSDKIAGIFEKSSDFENEEGLKIGGFIAPGLESAFRQDLSKVIKKGSFFKKINLPKVRTISQADVDAHNSGERPLGETDVLEEPKSTIFTPNF